MNIANMYRKIKQILNDSNAALVNKGFSEVVNLYEISDEINKIGEINQLPYVLRREIIEVAEEDIDGITKIAAHAFYECENLENITIPNSVLSIGQNAFANCTNLKHIYLKSTTPPKLNNTNAIPDTLTIHVPVGCDEAYTSATNWSIFADQIVSDIDIMI